MARVEQKYLVDREVVEHLIAMIKDGLARGATDREILDQTWEILDPQYRARTDQAFKEMQEGTTRPFRNADDMIRDLESD